MRRAGIAGLQRKTKTQQEFTKAASSLKDSQITHLEKQLDIFKLNLLKFAKTYQTEIKSDKNFRKHFQQMCLSIGVDPLASQKGFWANILGVGDFYFELGVQILQACYITRSKNGGLIEFGELKSILEKMRGGTIDAISISDDDILQSIKSLSPLGNGYIKVIQIGSARLVQSVPREINLDFTNVVSLAQPKGFVTVPELCDRLGWNVERSLHEVERLVKDGVCWIDLQSHPTQYWVASFFH